MWKQHKKVWMLTEVWMIRESRILIGCWWGFSVQSVVLNSVIDRFMKRISCETLINVTLSIAVQFCVDLIFCLCWNNIYVGVSVDRFCVCGSVKFLFFTLKFGDIWKIMVYSLVVILQYMKDIQIVKFIRKWYADML